MSYRFFKDFALKKRGLLIIRIPDFSSDLSKQLSGEAGCRWVDRLPRSFPTPG